MGGIEIKRKLTIEVKAIIVLCALVVVLASWLIIASGRKYESDNAYKREIEQLEKQQIEDAKLIEQYVKRYNKLQEAIDKLDQQNENIIYQNEIKRDSVRMLNSNATDSIARATLFN